MSLVVCLNYFLKAEKTYHYSQQHFLVTRDRSHPPTPQVNSLHNHREPPPPQAEPPTQLQFGLILAGKKLMVRSLTVTSWRLKL